MKVFVVDPSLFTLPYDRAFCRGLAEAGAEVTLVGRPLRPDEGPADPGYGFLPLFYRRSDRLAGQGGLGKALKGVEHAQGLTALARFVRQERPDVVHVQWLVVPPLDSLGYAWLARDVPLVLTVHNSVPFHGAAARLQKLGHDAALHRFAHYVAHTEQTVRYLEGLGIPAARITLLAHPPLTLAAPADLPARPPGPLRILLFGALKPYKGIDVLVQAGLALNRHRQDFHIVIAGKPFFPLEPLQAEVAAAVAADRFTFETRFLPDEALARQIAAADIVVFPYREVDASGALALAASFAKPIVASAVGVFAEPPARDRLRLVAPGDPAALAAALEDLLDDAAARQALATGSRALVGALPGWPAFAGACLDAYRNLPVVAKG